MPQPGELVDFLALVEALPAPSAVSQGAPTGDAAERHARPWWRRKGPRERYYRRAAMLRPRRPRARALRGFLVVACRGGSSGAGDAGRAQLGAVDSSAAKKPPALRAAKLATPPLPDLPSLA